MKSPFDTEIERKHIEHTNIIFAICMIGIIITVFAIINPVAFLIGVILGKRNKNLGFFSSIGILFTSFVVSIIYVFIGKVSIKVQCISFFMNFYEVFNNKKMFLTFLEDYFMNPLYITFFSFAVGAGVFIFFYFSTDSKEQHARKESRKRYKNGEETSFFEDINLIEFKESILKGHTKKLTHTEIKGTVLGKSKTKNVFITDVEAAAHGMVIGTTGAGKTTVLLKFVESCAERALSMFFIDGKGDYDLPDKMRKLAKKYNRKFYHFDMKGEKSKLCYNPLFLGNADNTKEKLIDTTDWSEAHYKSAAERVLMLITNVVNQILKEMRELEREELKNYFETKEGEPIPRIKKDILCLQDMLTPSVLERAIRSVKDDDLRNKWIRIYEKLNPDWYMGLEQRLALIAESGVGELVKETRSGIKLTTIMDEKAIILFSLNALENRNVTEMMGRLIVKDINTAISLKKNKDVVYSVFDEHGAYISEDVASQFAMARSFGLVTITSTQNISDYEKTKLKDILRDKVVENTNFKIIMKQNETENTEYLAKTIGTHKKMDKSMSTDYEGRFKGLGIKKIEEFIVNPNVIKNLGTGEVIVMKTIPRKKVIQDVKIDCLNLDEENILVEDEKNNMNTEEKKEEIIDNPNSFNLPNKEKFKGYDPLARRKKRKNIN